MFLLPANMVAAAIVQNRRRRSIPAPASTSLFVSKTGSDANDGLSSGAPVLTFANVMSKALSNAAITTIIAQGAGTWAETLTYTRNGLTVSFTGGGVIDGGATRTGVDLAGKDDCAIVGASITNTVSDSYGIVGTAAHRTLVDSCTLASCPRGIFLLNSTGVIIRSSVIHDATFRHGIELRTCTGALIQDVETYNCVGRGVYLYGTSSSTVRRLYTHDNGLSNYGLEMEAFGATLADNNLVVDSWAGITTGNQKYGFIDKLNVGGTSNRFQRCVAWGNGAAGAGAGFYAKAGQMKMYHCDAYNNIYGVYIGADTPGSEAPSANVDIKNNIIKNNTTYGMFVAAGSESGLASDNNAWHNNTSFINYNGAGYTSATWQAAGFDLSSLFTTDPAYASTVYGGFVPGAGGLTIGADLGEGAGLKIGHTASSYGS
jgi:hypothetical protein